MEEQFGIKVCETAEIVREMYEHAMEDGRIDLAEDNQIRAALRLNVRACDEERAAIDCALTLLRSGMSPKAVRKVREQATSHPHLRIVALEQDNDWTPPRAA